MIRVFFDESGQTGTHLFDLSQPYFCLGSTDVIEEDAAEVLRRVFPRQQGPELKSSNILKHKSGRRQFLTFAEEVATRPNSFCVAKISKRYAVVSKIVDQLVEPMLHEIGYDFYKGGYSRRFANSVGFMVEHLLPRADADRMLASYNAFARDPNLGTLRSFISEIDALLAGAPKGVSVFLDMIAHGARRAEARQDFFAFEGSNEIHVTAAIECMKFWQEKHAGPFEVVHDESTHFFRYARSWKMMTDPTVEPQVITIGDKTLTFPIPVTSTVSAGSHEIASLQLCDLVAGFVSRMSAQGASDEFRAFVQEAIEAGMGEVTVYPVDFGTEFAEGEPARADGPDVMDQIVHAVQRKRPARN